MGDEKNGSKSGELYKEYGYLNLFELNVSVFTYTLNAIYTENKIITIANEIFNDCMILEKSTAAFN